jgi:hypothetical protein
VQRGLVGLNHKEKQIRKKKVVEKRTWEDAREKKKRQKEEGIRGKG